MLPYKLDPIASVTSSQPTRSMETVMHVRHHAQANSQTTVVEARLTKSMKLVSGQLFELKIILAIGQIYSGIMQTVECSMRMIF